jgi:hypothetical protein
MNTQCPETVLTFQPLPNRQIVAQFDGGTITTDAGALLLREVEHATGILRQFADCFTDHRDQDRIEHSVLQLISQRIYGLCLGYEDLNDHDQLRHDPLLAVLVGKTEPAGTDRRLLRDRGKALAGKSTLNRLELTPTAASPASRYKKITARIADIDCFLVEVFLQQHSEPPTAIILDLDATDDPLHGDQNGRFFHGYYKCYCYLPLYIFCGDHLLCARLRPAKIDAAAGSREELTRIVGQIRERWPTVAITIRGDSGFCRDWLMNWCEAHGVDFVLGLGQNTRLKAELTQAMQEAQSEHQQTGQAARRFVDFYYQTLESWSRERRVVGKAEYLEKGENPRFVVTSLGGGQWAARELYEEVYCARGELENRIKEQQNYLFADRTSCQSLRANQLRLYFSSVAYLLMSALRRLGLPETESACWQCERIRTSLLKLGGRVKVSVRRVWISLSESWPNRSLFVQVYQRLRERAERYDQVLRGPPLPEV